MQTKELAYSISDACKLSSVGRTTLYGAIKRGDLTTRKIGRRTLVPADALAAWLENLPINQRARSQHQVGRHE